MILRHLNVIVAALLVMGAVSSAAADSPATQPTSTKSQIHFPLGVYLSWERPIALAKSRGVDHWKDVCDRLDLLAQNGVNTLWVTNLSEADFPRLIKECAQRKLALLVNLSSIEARVPDRWANNGAYYDAVIPRVVKLAGNSPTVIGWVLSDEPTVEQMPWVERLRKRFKAINPERFCTVVGTWSEAPSVPLKTCLPVVCVDLYPFFGPNDPNGPHTDETSKAFYRDHLVETVQAARKYGRIAWVMAQCFNEVWGPRRYSPSGTMIGLPGSYLHWRAPTLAEMRWQVWQAVRDGVQGIFFYTLAPEAPSVETHTLPPPKVAWTNVLATAPTDMGPNALTNPDATATTQLNEMGKLYRTLEPHTGLMLRWHRQPASCIQIASPMSSSCFIDPSTGGQYLVLVNDDLHNRAEAQFRLPSQYKSAREVSDSASVSANVDRSLISVRLNSGAGVIIQLERTP